MSKLIMMKGIPASGKSTRAQEIAEGGGNWVRLNRDLLRDMLHFGKYSGKNESAVVACESKLAGHFLGQGKNVIIDDCNINPKNQDMWQTVANLNDAKFEVVFVDTPLGDCLFRNQMRERTVPRHVIENMALEAGVHPDSKEEFVICDIDGTIADVSHRVHHVKGEVKDWKSFFESMMDDTVREDVKDMLIEYQNQGKVILFVSARPEDYREQTEHWLKSFVTGVYPVSLLMRQRGDTRPDTEVKRDIYHKYLKDLDIFCVVDDRPCVIRMWEDLDLKVVDVGEGNEF